MRLPAQIAKELGIQQQDNTNAFRKSTKHHSDKKLTRKEQRKMDRQQKKLRKTRNDDNLGAVGNERQPHRHLKRHESQSRRVDKPQLSRKSNADKLKERYPALYESLAKDDANIRRVNDDPDEDERMMEYYSKKLKMKPAGTE
ncbi:hypothetical protein MIR68_000857 [Amoeboaphelidium protococcarum]|nr:hypothetical protein MIR68_000857 [Amoeboaphelidium protococcarum]